jgi:hypothetical protein
MHSYNRIVIGPLLIFDKSLLHLLSAEEFSELSFHFRIVVAPVLIKEIIADLTSKRKDRIPEDTVAMLARKMMQAHGGEPVHWQHLAAGNLLGQQVPMFGSVPVGGRPNVFRTKDGRGLVYDMKPEQEIWQRWAAGNFNVGDLEIAHEWRDDLKQLDLQDVHLRWQAFSRERFPHARSVYDLVCEVDKIMSTYDLSLQKRLLLEMMELLGVKEDAQRAVMRRWIVSKLPLLRDFAPYASYVLRLYLIFAFGISTGLVSTRASNAIDLEYLFYVPFCMVFSSADNFHQDMWAASAGRNSFVHGADLKEDLRCRCEQLKQAVPAGSMADSVIGRLWTTYMRTPPPKKQITAADSGEKLHVTIDDLEPEIRDDLKSIFKELDEHDTPM